MAGVTQVILIPKASRFSVCNIEMLKSGPGDEAILSNHEVLCASVSSNKITCTCAVTVFTNMHWHACL